MTVGQLSRRTGVPIGLLREYERLGLVLTLGRSEGNYRLFGEEVSWCVQVIQGPRSLGLTLKEIQKLVTVYLDRPDEPIGAILDEKLARASARVEARIADLEALRRRIVGFRASGESAHASSSSLARLFASDPRRAAAASAS